jgi:hypothetical protein
MAEEAKFLEQYNYINNCLNQILGNDNEARKGAEASLNSAKDNDIDSYAKCLASTLNPNSQSTDQAKNLAAVILRRNISVSDIATSDVLNKGNNENIWKRISVESRNYVKSEVLGSLSSATPISKAITHKVCNLAVEIQGAMHEFEGEAIWQELLTLVFTCVNEQMDCKVDAGL